MFKIKKNKIEYVWLDGYKPEPTLRSKIKIVDRDCVDVLEVPEWSFDGSSTQQAKRSKSDLILKPVSLYKSPFESDQLVLCEVLDQGGIPHESNSRSKITSINQEEYWFGFEQEYTLIKDGKPLGWPAGYIDATTLQNIANKIDARMSTGREIMHEHISNCLEAGITLHGTNAEAMLGQWEYQVFGKGAIKAADSAWMARYILYRTAEKYGIDINIQPKPVEGPYSGNGLHANFSNDKMRNDSSKSYIHEICEKMRPLHKEHIAEYGSKNEERLIGKFETQHINKFSYGVADRGASIRIPLMMVQQGWKGYLEDRRPAGNADPYRVVNRIILTLEK